LSTPLFASKVKTEPAQAICSGARGLLRHRPDGYGLGGRRRWRRAAHKPAVRVTWTKTSHPAQKPASLTWLLCKGRYSGRVGVRDSLLTSGRKTLTLVRGRKSPCEVSGVREAKLAASLSGLSDRSFGSVRSLTAAASKELPCPGRGKVFPLHYLQRYAAENARQDEPSPRLTSLWNFGLADIAP
jgi:hypothetical protein